MKKNLVFSLLAVAALWAGWAIAYAAVGNGYLLPSVRETLSEMFALFSDSSFWRAFGNTLWRTAAAFFASFAGGVLLSVFAYLRKEIRAFFAPIVSVLRTVPTMAVILMLLIWTSPSAAPVIVALLVLLPAVYAAALASFDEANAPYQTLVRAYRVPLYKRVFQMILPLGAPSILKQSGAIFSMGLKITISAEVLSNTYRSLGGMMQEAKMYLETPRLFALTLIAVLAGFLMEGLCALLVRLIVRWRT